MAITVHHLEYSRSVRILWLLEELGIAYEIKRYARDPKTFRGPPEIKQIHPLGRFPVVDADGIILAESGAIIEHFVTIHEQLRPSDPAELRRFRFFMHYAEGSVMPPLLVRLILDKLRTSKMPFFIKPIAKGIASKVDAAYSGPEIKRHFAFIESELATRPYFCGEAFSAADIQMSYPVEAGLTRGAANLPNTRAWLTRVQARAGYQHALDKGGPAMPPKRT